MKKNLLKSALLALMVLIGGSAWAAEGDVTTNVDIDFNTDIATASTTPKYSIAGAVGAMNWNQQWTMTPNITEGVLRFGNFDGGEVVLQNANIGKRDKVTITFDLAFGKIGGKHVGFKLVDSEGNDLLQQWFDAYNGDFDDANPLNLDWAKMYRGSNTPIWERCVKFTIAIDYATKKITTNTTCLMSGAGKAATDGEFTADLAFTAPIAKFTLQGNVNNADRYSCFDNLKITTTEGNYDVATANYTVKFVCNGTEIKDAETREGDVNASISASATDKTNFTLTDGSKRYIYVSDDAEGKTVANDGSTILTITYREAAKYTYTINSKVGTTALAFTATGSVWEDENSITVQYPRFQANGAVLVERQPNNNNLSATYTVANDAFEQTLEYTATNPAINNLYLLKEAEDLGTELAESATSFTTRVSGGKIIFAAKGNLITLPAGKYIFTLGAIGGDGTNHKVAYKVYAEATPTEEGAEHNADNLIAEGECTGNFLTQITSKEFELSKNTVISFTSSDPSSARGIDLIYVQKTGDYVITPAYGKIWENGETTTDENQNTIAEVSAAYFNDFAKAKDTVRVAVEVTSPSVPSAPARNIAKGSISAFAGPDNIFSKTGIELGADTIDIILTDDALAKIKEAESLKFVYTNLTLKSIELIEAVADSAVLAEQAKLQDEITKAEGMLADENKTNGKDEFLTAINAAKALLTSIDIDAIKAGITALQTAEQTFIKANYFIDIAAGQYYIIDTKTGKFIAAGHNYGTRGIVNTIGLDLTITPNTESRKVTIDTRIANEGNHFLGTNLYMDAVVAEWALEYRGFGFWITNGTQYISIDENDNLVMSDEPREWIIVTPEGVKEQRMEDMATATKDAPKDATWAIQCANFNRNDQRISAWKVSEDCTNKNLSGGSDDNRCAESWHSTFTISQTLTGMPKGVYALTAQGFYRQDGDNTEATPVFFANEETGAVSAKTGNEDNMNDASASFSAGNYTINPIYVEVGTDSILKVGIKGTATSQWVIFDNFQLKYYGSEVSIDELKNAAIYAEMLALREQLKNIKPEVEIQVIKDSIDNVLNSTENPEGAEAINNTIVSLKAVLEVAQAYVKVKTILPNMKQFTEETNFYTEEALNQYYTQWVAKYQNGTLTKDEADALKDPFLIAGWRSANTIDDLLMSVWDENPENWESYHVNNWSTEGGTDGTNFVVPFIEYWTGDANNLAPKTLTATINNLEQGNYQVSVRVRVRVKDGANDPTGITMTVNDELPTNVCAGTQVGETQFYMDEFTAVGDVYSDGVLKFKFNVLESNNISWLAFKDVVYTRLSDVVGIAGVKSENKLDGTVYNLNGQKVEKAQRGLYIMNGKKVVVK